MSSTSLQTNLITRRGLFASVLGFAAAAKAAQQIQPTERLYPIWWELGPVVNGVQMWSLGCDLPGEWTVWMWNLQADQMWMDILDTGRDCRFRNDLTMKPGEILNLSVVAFERNEEWGHRKRALYNENILVMA